MFPRPAEEGRMPAPESTIYRDVADRLRAAISDGTYPPGSQLPSESEVAETYGISRNTARRSFAALREDGLITSQQGARRIVLAEPRLQNFNELRSFSRWARQIGEEPAGRAVRCERSPATATEAERLGLGPGGHVVHLTRVRLLSGQPVMIERTAYVERIGALLSLVDLDRESVCERLAEHGVVFARAEHVIDAVNADEEDARLLDIEPGTALLRERRRTTDHDGHPLEWSEDRYLGDAVAFTVQNSLAAAPLSRLRHAAR
jgi:GntR family transcriptional regulator